jgi:hypothetical protein
MTFWDLFITPFYIILVFSIGQVLRKSIKDKTIRPYFLPAIRVKIIGAIALGVVYQFYYDGGDTYNFYRDGSIVWGVFTKDTLAWLEILVSPVENRSPHTYVYTQYIYFFLVGDNSSFNLIRIIGLYSILTFNVYSSIAVLFALTSFSGIWAMYRVFYHMYPQLHKPLAYAVLFIPSVYFWGSGVVKDSICIGCLGWVFYGFYFGLIARTKIIQNIFIAFLAGYVLYGIKSYILFSFVGGLTIWLFMQYRANIKNAGLRAILLPFALSIGVVAGYYAILQLTINNAKYQLENIAEVSRVSSEWLEYVSREQKGSTYSLGITDWTPQGILAKSPQALWLAIFQPHPWQARNPIMMLSAIESLFFLFLTIKLLFTVNIFKILNITTSQPIILLCLVFTFILGLGVAINSGNYGTMVRYRIPYQPFYLAMIYILRYYGQGKTSLY